MDPITAALVQAGVGILTKPRAASQAELNAALEQQRKAERQKWMIGGALVGGALLVYLVASRR